MRTRSQRKVIMYCLMIALFLTTVGYALMKASLNINGEIVKEKGTWHIYFDNINIISPASNYTGNHISLDIEPLSNNGTVLDFNAKLTKPGDQVQFTVDVINGGDVDAILEEVVLTKDAQVPTEDIVYTATWADGSTIEAGFELLTNKSKKILITVTYDIDATYAPETDNIIDLGLSLRFVQTVGNENPGIIEGDTSLASTPNLLNNSLTPVVYDETRASWVVADTTKSWYNYSQQQWANAVMLNSGVIKNVGDPVIVPTVTSGGEIDATSEVKAMYVWIPRYEYKIEGQYGTHTDGTLGTQALPGEIEVNFIPQSQTTATTGYILHPAFTWNVSENYDEDGKAIIEANEHLTGIWVGKFETTGTADAPTILPNTSSFGTQDIPYNFRIAQKLGTYLNNTSNTDSHMMKNSEWGAVAYLSQSIYGKYGNSAYSGANKEVYQNKSDSYLTGNSNGTPSVGSSGKIETQCTYDDITDRGNGIGSCGGGASTTGNIYGVYDMSGGAGEYVMGYLTTAYENGLTEAGFTSVQEGRYFDAYTSTTSTTACNGGICYGHALSETSRWYNDWPSEDGFVFVTTGDPWFLRGGNSGGGSTSNTGVFYSSKADSFSGADSGLGSISFRAVLFAPGA